MNPDFIVSLISKIRENSVDYINRKLQEHSIADLNSRYGSILSLLYKNNGRLTMKEISILANKRKSTITDMVRKLENCGYVKKCECDADGRVTYVNLTEKAYSIQEKFYEISKALYTKLYKDFTNDEKKQLMQLLQKIEKNSK